MKLLSDSKNYAVVHLPERKYPGLVLQGDTLARIVKSLEACRKIYKKDEEEFLHIIEGLIEDFELAANKYKEICAQNGINLPENFVDL